MSTFQTALSIVIPIAALLFPLPFLVALGQHLENWFLSRLPAAQRARLRAIINDVVQATEQYGSAQALPDAQKRAKAIADATAIAHAWHLPVTDTEIAVLVDALTATVRQAVPVAPTTTTASASAPSVPVASAPAAGL